MSEGKTLIVGSSPQIRDADTTAGIMWHVSIALIPAGIWGVYLFGLRSLLVILISIAAAAAAEYGIARMLKRQTLADGSAVLTGLLIGYNMPPLVPLYIPVAASFFAIAVVKWAFGGLGANWMNPALAGRAFVFFSWTTGMNAWQMPRTWAGIDGASSATPLGTVQTGLFDVAGEGGTALSYLESISYAASGWGSSLADWFSGTVGLNVSAHTADLFIGAVPGSIGEVSALLLILGGVYLLYKRIITWEIPVSFLVSFALLIWIFEGTLFSRGLFSGSVGFHLFSGGLILGAIFMATDMVTSPVTGRGMIIYGIGAGFLTFLIRLYGSLPEGVSLAIILMNIFVPIIDRYVQPKPYGFKKQKTGRNAA